MAMAILGNENAISSHCLWPLLVVEEPYDQPQFVTGQALCPTDNQISKQRLASEAR
jgi:hypothetical protein